MDDPDRQYTDAVKSALIDAMLDHSLSMDLGPDEWLTVAARQSEGRSRRTSSSMWRRSCCA